MAFLTVLLWALVAAILVGALIGGFYVHATRRIARQAERLVPPAGTFIDIDGDRLHYLETGEGKPIVFLHGLGAQLLQFRHLLFGELAGFRLIALDRPGSGYSTRRTAAGARLPEQARIVARFIAALGLPERPLLVGHSLGGAVALTVALEHPDTIAGLALLSPLTHHVEPIQSEFRSLYVPSALRRRLLAETTAIPLALKMAPQTLAFLFSPQAPHPDYMIKGGGWIGLRPSHYEATVADFTALGSDLPGLEARYSEIRLPVGILFGSADPVLDHQVHGLALGGIIDDLDIEIVDGIGHMTHYAAVLAAAAFIRRLAHRAFGRAWSRTGEPRSGA